jgi:hypothetical protein
MKNNLTIFFLLIALVAQAQVIPVGFIKKGGNPIIGNLLLYLDATRTASYGGTGTTWTDISGQSNHATLTGSPTFESGSFTFAANKNALTSQLITASLSSATFVAWVNPSQTQNMYAGIIFSRAGKADATAPATGLNFYINNSIGYHWNDNPSSYNWNSGLQPPLNAWSLIAVTINSTSATVYLFNANGIISSRNSVSHPTLSGLKFYVGTEPFNLDIRAFVGRIGIAMVYNTALSQEEITSIFNAQKASFGL